MQPTMLHRLVVVVFILLSAAFLVHAADAGGRLAVLELSVGGGMQPDDGKTLGSFIRDAIVRTGKIEVMDRQRMKDILAEQNFSQAMCDNAQGLVKVGKMLDVNRVLGGQVSKFGNVWTVSLNLVDVSTAKLLGSRAVPYEGRMEDLLTVGPMVALQLLGLSDAVIGQQVAALGSDSKVQWHAYRSEVAGYSIQMPGEPKEQPRRKASDSYSVMCQVGSSEIYSVACHERDDFAAVAAKVGADKMLRTIRNGVMDGPKLTLRSEKDLALDGHPGLECIADNVQDNSVTLWNAYIVGNRLYQLVVNVPRGSENSTTVLKFFYSFRLLPAAGESRAK
jgi:TolB-like protein